MNWATVAVLVSGGDPVIVAAAKAALAPPAPIPVVAFTRFPILVQAIPIFEAAVPKAVKAVLILVCSVVTMALTLASTQQRVVPALQIVAVPSRLAVPPMMEVAAVIVFSLTWKEFSVAAVGHAVPAVRA